MKPTHASTEDLKDIYHFLDKHFRKEKEWSVLEEYPLAFDHKNQHNIRIIKHEGEIISHAVLKTALIKTPYAIYNVAMIGSVATHPGYQRQGLSSQVIEDCIEQAQKQNCDFILLWTDMFDFYRKFGFELAGSEVSLILQDSFKPEENRPDIKIIEGNQVDPQAILRLHNLHSVCTNRSINDIKKFLQIPNMRIYTAWNENNQMEAYAVEGKGIDLQGYVHEWGGNTTALVKLFKHIQTNQKKEIIVITPPHCKNIILQCEKAGAKKFDGILGMIKILDIKSLTKKIQRTARRMGIKDFAIDMHGDQLYFGTSEGVYKTDSQADMVHMIFGPQKPSQIHQFNEYTANQLNRVLPVPMWVWGWDSI